MSQFIQLFMICGLMLMGAQKWARIQENTRNFSEILRQSWLAEQQLYHCLYTHAQAWNRESQAIPMDEHPCEHHQVTIGTSKIILTGSLVLEKTKHEQFDQRNWFIAFSNQRVSRITNHYEQSLNWSH